MENVKVIGCGSYNAACKITNSDLESIVDTSDEWIQQRTGIESRYITKNENTSDLAYRAALAAIEDANIDVREIDLIIVATSTPDNFTPSCACLVMERLGLNGNHVMAFDINAACSGFIYSIHVASMMLKQCRCALVIGAETLSKIVDWTDRNTCVLFGDGAGAVLLKTSGNHKMCSFSKSIGDNKGALISKGASLKEPLKNCDKTFQYLSMDGKEVFRFAVKAMQESIEEVCKLADVDVQEIDLVIPHQANLRIINHVQKKMKIDESKIFVNLQEYGNTSAASIAIALSEAKNKGLIQKGMKIVLSGFGAGFTYGAVYLEW